MEVKDNDRFSSDRETAPPKTGPAADGADIASTDMETNPGVGLPVEPSYEAIRRLENEAAELRDRQLRLAAEFDNYRKRVARERVELSDRAQAAFVIRLLDVLDDMDRIATTDVRNTPAESLHEALVLVDRKLRKELEAAGVERIDPAGAAFNPAEHEAVSTVPTNDPGQDHKVSATFQTGYRFKGQLVRPARVQVYSVQGAG